ncbi:MAG TPA: 50S ribosomal protein L5 [Patescibacteria group bacterium]|nr:50S ribosomal protein L5 [Patescibacteria group bacterium]
MIELKTVNAGLKKDLGDVNLLALPRLEKVVLNCGIGRMKDDKGFVEEVVNTFKTVSGQKPVMTKAKKAIAGFKVREGDAVGVMVTLRGKRMLSFIERLANIALPRIRDFKGLKFNNFDRQGNYTLAVKEQVIFPEIPYDKVSHTHGFQITFKILNGTPATSRKLLEKLGLPFEKDNTQNTGVKNG